MSQSSIIDLYTDLATNPDKDFGWEKGLNNALKHGYKDEWIQKIPDPIWQYCAAVANPFIAGDFKQGDTILDIGCGAGIDLCVASLLTGENGHVIGVDITPAMVIKAKQNAHLANLVNISVYEASIEKLPIKNSSVDIVISNGAINLSSSKESVFSEIYRVLAEGGQLCFADMIKDEGHIEEQCQEQTSWANCIAGTLKSRDLINLMEDAGFSNVSQVFTSHYKTSLSTIAAVFKASK